MYSCRAHVVRCHNPNPVDSPSELFIYKHMKASCLFYHAVHWNFCPTEKQLIFQGWSNTYTWSNTFWVKLSTKIKGTPLSSLSTVGPVWQLPSPALSSMCWLLVLGLGSHKPEPSDTNALFYPQRSVWWTQRESSLPVNVRIQFTILVIFFRALHVNVSGLLLSDTEMFNSLSSVSCNTCAAYWACTFILKACFEEGDSFVLITSWGLALCCVQCVVVDLLGTDWAPEITVLFKYKRSVLYFF